MPFELFFTENEIDFDYDIYPYNIPGPIFWCHLLLFILGARQSHYIGTSGAKRNISVPRKIHIKSSFDITENMDIFDSTTCNMDIKNKELITIF